MTKQTKALLISCLCFLAAIGYLTYWHTHAQQTGSYNTNSTSAPSGSCPSGSIDMVTPTSSPFSPFFYACGNDTNWYGPYNQSPYVGYNWTVVAGLFSTNQMLGAVYYFPQGATIYAIAARISGSPICTAAPTISIRDLGTTVSTSFASSTQLASIATSTSNGAFATTGLSAVIGTQHYIGLALTAGTCVTPPQVDATVTVQ